MLAQTSEAGPENAAARGPVGQRLADLRQAAQGLWLSSAGAGSSARPARQRIGEGSGDEHQLADDLAAPRDLVRSLGFGHRDALGDDHLQATGCKLGDQRL